MTIKDFAENIGIEGLDFEGEIVEVYERRAGSGQYGPYSFQNILLADGEAKITASIRNRDEITSEMKGQVFKFSSAPDKNGKMKGVRIEEDKWKDKETGEEHSKVQVVITPSAKMSEIKEKEGTEKPKPSAPKSAEKKTEMSKSDWELKDLRVARMAAIKDSAFFVEATSAVTAALVNQGIVGVEADKLEAVMERIHTQLKKLGEIDRKEFTDYVWGSEKEVK